MAIKFNKLPVVQIDHSEENITVGWKRIWETVQDASVKLGKLKVVIVIECYHGVDEEGLLNSIRQYFSPNHLILARESMYREGEIEAITFSDVTNDRVFGFMTRLHMQDLFDSELLERQHARIKEIESGMVVVVGPGASLLAPDSDILIYADMTRWEIQKRLKEKKTGNLGLSNQEELFETKYKRGYFVDWRICDRLKKKRINDIGYFLDSTNTEHPKMIGRNAFFNGLEKVVRQPFSLAPFFDPGPWGGQWMKEVFGLDQEATNYAWCFNCVPEENSLLFKFGKEVFEMPAINLVFFKPVELLGNSVHARFGDEFPIRFDYLDTMDGENLSLQVHPVTEYIQEAFGMHYTQDESYYLMAVKEGGCVYLGLKEGIDPTTMAQQLQKASEDGEVFDAEEYVEIWPAKKHDHFSIPAGTIHCSGKNTMVLEISATPYIFTFKLWDWGRNGMDGRPRPTHIDHGLKNIQWNRTKNWVANNLVDNVEKIGEGDCWVEERTGLHEREFIETRRHWFTGKTFHNTGGTVNVLNLVEGKEIIVESPEGAFPPSK